MSRIGTPLVVIISVLAWACGTTVQSSGGLAHGKSVQASSRVLVIGLVDAVEKSGSTLGRSGGAITAAVHDALVAHSYSPIVGDSKTLVDGFTEAEKLGYDYVLKGALINWKETELGMLDTAGLSLELYEVASKSFVASATANVRASMFTYTPGSDPLAAALADLALARIFGWTPAQSSLTPK